MDVRADDLVRGRDETRNRRVAGIRGTNDDRTVTPKTQITQPEFTGQLSQRTPRRPDLLRRCPTILDDTSRHTRHRNHRRPARDRISNLPRPVSGVRAVPARADAAPSEP